MGTGQEDRGRDHRQALSPRLSCSGTTLEVGDQRPRATWAQGFRLTLPRADGSQRPVPGPSAEYRGAPSESDRLPSLSQSRGGRGDRNRLHEAPPCPQENVLHWRLPARRLRLVVTDTSGPRATEGQPACQRPWPTQRATDRRSGTCHQINHRRHRSAAASATDQDGGHSPDGRKHGILKHVSTIQKQEDASDHDLEGKRRT